MFNQCPLVDKNKINRLNEISLFFSLHSQLFTPCNLVDK